MDKFVTNRCTNCRNTLADIRQIPPTAILGGGDGLCVICRNPVDYHSSRNVDCILLACAMIMMAGILSIVIYSNWNDIVREDVNSI